MENPIKTPFTLDIVGDTPVTLIEYSKESLSEFTEALTEEEKKEAYDDTIAAIGKKAIATRYRPDIAQHGEGSEEAIQAQNELLAFCRNVNITAELEMLLTLVGFEPIKIHKCEDPVFSKHTNEWLKSNGRKLQEVLLKDFTDYTLSQLEPTLEKPDELPCKELLKVIRELSSKGQLVEGVEMFDFEVAALPTATDSPDAPKQQAWFNCIKFDEPEDAEIDI